MSKSFSGISVKDITEACGISRNTFYYHFQDKYELMHWILNEDMVKYVKSYDDPCRLAESFVAICQFMYQDRDTYFELLKYQGQNSLQEFLTNFYYELAKLGIVINYDNSGFKLQESEVEVFARMNAHALVGLINDWVESGMHGDYMKYFDQVDIILSIQSELYAIMSENLMTKGARPSIMESRNGTEVS